MATEKIKIFELDIDVDAAIESQSRLKSTLDSTKVSLNALKKSGDTSSQQYVEMQAEVKDLSREYNAAQTQLGKLLKIQGKEIKTVEQGRNALTIINKEWSKQASLFGVNSKEADKLAGKHLELKNRVNELQKGIGDTSANIGNYSKDFQEAIGKTSLFGRATGIVTEAMGVVKPVINAVKTEVAGVSSQYKTGAATAKTYSGAQKAVAIGTNLSTTALKLFKIALISTGIGAIIVLLGSAVAFFSKTQKGIDFVNTALAALGAGFDVVIDRASKFFGALIKFATGDISGAIDDIKGTFSGLGDEISREIGLAIKLEQMFQRVEKAEINLDIRRSAANARLKELKLATDDITKSETERLAAAREFAKIETELTAEQVSNQEKKVAGLLGFDKVTEDVREKIRQIGQEGVSLDQLGLSESTIEDAKAFRDEIGKLFELQGSSFDRQTENQNKLNAIEEGVRKKREADAKELQGLREKSIDAAIKENQTRLKLFTEQSKGKADSLSESLSFEQTARDARLSILQQEIKAGKKTKAQAALEEYQIKEEYLSREKDLVIEYAQEELEIYKSKNQSRLDNGQLLTDALVTQETNRLRTIADQQLEFEAKRLEQGVISEREYNVAIDEVNEEFRVQRTGLEQERREQKNEKDVIDLENKRLLEQETFAYDLDSQLEQLDRRKAQEVAAAIKAGADVELINERYAAERIAVEGYVRAAKIDMAANAFSNIADLIGRETALGKAAAIAAVIGDRAAAVSRIVASTAVANAKAAAASPLTFGQPWVTVNTITGAIGAATAIASGIKAISEISSTGNAPKAEKGGLLVGNRHSSGGIPIEAEGGEYVMNRKSTSLFYPVIEYMNNIGNGGKGSSSGTYMADGGMVARSISSGSATPNININSEPFDYDLFARLTGDAVRLLPPQVTDVKDVITNVNNYNKVVNGANL